MDTTGSVGISWPGAIPAEMETSGPDDGLGADVDEMLVVEGTLGEEEAGAMAHPPETPAPGIVRPDRPQLDARPPTSRAPDRDRARRSGPGRERAQLTPEC